MLKLIRALRERRIEADELAERTPVHIVLEISAISHPLVCGLARTRAAPGEKLYLHPNAAVLCLPAFAHTRLMESADMRAKQLLNALT